MESLVKNLSHTTPVDFPDRGMTQSAKLLLQASHDVKISLSCLHNDQDMCLRPEYSLKCQLEKSEQIDDGN